MRMKTANTLTGDAEGLHVKYDVTYKEFESLDEAAEATGGADSLLAIINASQRQNALQSQKSSVLKALNEHKDPNHEKVREAVMEHQKYASEYVIGKPRGGRSGQPTKKQMQQIGERITERALAGKPMSAADLKALYEEYGIAAPGSK